MRGIGDHDAVERVITMAWRTHPADAQEVDEASMRHAWRLCQRVEAKQFRPDQIVVDLDAQFVAVRILAHARLGDPGALHSTPDEVIRRGGGGRLGVEADGQGSGF